MNYLVEDPTGLFVEQANGLAAGGKNKVKYWTMWESAQKFEWFAIGKGFDYLEKERYPQDWYDWADCIVNFGVTGQGQITHLRKVYPKKSIFGSGKCSKIEHDRWGLKKIIRDVGLPVNKTEKIIGVAELRKHLTKNKDKYVKINIDRGDVESFYAKDIDSVDLKLDELASMLGPFKEKYEFIVEDAIHTDVEIGYDGFFNGNDYLKPYFYGYEYKKQLYVARVSDTLPKQLQETLDAFKPVLQKLDYRAGISTEEKIVSKSEHYFLDITCRLPSPLSALYQEYILNWPEVVYKIGLKQPVKLDIKHKYLASLPLGSEHANTNWVELDIDKKDRDHIKFVSACKNDGKYYAVKGYSEIVVVIAGGDTVDEVLGIIKKYADRVDADGLDKKSVFGIDHIKDIIEDGKKLGLSF